MLIRVFKIRVLALYQFNKGIQPDLGRFGRLGKKIHIKKSLRYFIRIRRLFKRFLFISIPNFKEKEPFSTNNIADSVLDGMRALDLQLKSSSIVLDSLKHRTATHLLELLFGGTLIALDVITKKHFKKNRSLLQLFVG